MSRKTLSAAALFVFFTVGIRPRLGTALLWVGYTPERTCFAVNYRGESSSYKVTPVFVLPGEEVKLAVTSDDPTARFDINAGWTRDGANAWVWKAPRKSGYYPATVTESRSGETMALNVFVMVPYSKMSSERINGYRIGRYPKIPSAMAAYTLPRGFIEVTPAMKDVAVSPHFKLGQFLCKQTGSYPKYIVLRERLILKLELMLEHVNAEGIAARTFKVMSGYRTPYYNRQLRNVRYSRHMWGDAADIYINNDPEIDAMDDLNGDGKRDARDALVLYHLVDQMNDEPGFKHFIGGLGWYKPTDSHGPFVHVDARGTPAHWNSN